MRLTYHTIGMRGRCASYLASLTFTEKDGQKISQPLGFIAKGDWPTTPGHYLTGVWIFTPHPDLYAGVGVGIDPVEFYRHQLAKVKAELGAMCFIAVCGSRTGIVRRRAVRSA